MTDQDTTQQMPAAEPPPATPGRKRLLRSRSDRMLGGVSGGLAEYFGVDPVIFRVGFFATVFFGGLGIFVYLAMIVFVPSDEGGGQPAPRSFGRIVLGFLLVIGGSIGLGVMGVVAAYVAATGKGAIVALLIILAGALVAVGAFKSKARWLILPALALALPLGAVAAADVSWDGGVGKREYRPASFAAVPDEGYELGIGAMEVDLRDLPWKESSALELRTEQGIGETLIAVPSDVCVTGIADVGAGNLDIAGEQTDGLDVQAQPNAGSPATPRLKLDAELDMGQIRVINDDDVDLSEYVRRHSDDGRGAEMREAMALACRAEADEKEVKGRG